MARPRTPHPLILPLALALLCAPAPTPAIPIVTSQPSVGGSLSRLQTLTFTRQPTLAQLAEARRRIGRHALHVWAGDVELTFRHASLDTLGIHFGAREPIAATQTDSAGVAHPLRAEWLPVSPLPWERIDAVTIAKPRGIEGAAYGGVLGLVALLAAVGEADEASGGESLGFIAPWVLLAPPAGAVLGGVIGSGMTRPVPVLERVPDESPAGTWPDQPAEPAKAAAPDERAH